MVPRRVRSWSYLPSSWKNVPINVKLNEYGNGHEPLIAFSIISRPLNVELDTLS